MPIAAAKIISDPAIHRGEPVIAGTSTTVRAIAELWTQGLAAEEIPLHLPHLELVQVFEALRYYLTNRDLIDQRISANRIPETWHGKRWDPETGPPESTEKARVASISLQRFPIHQPVHEPPKPTEKRL